MPELKQCKDEVLRKIGRNVLNFQQLERQLKFVISIATESGTLGASGTIHSNREKRIAKTRTKTMGQLIGQVVDEFHRNTPAQEPPEHLDQFWISSSFRVVYDDEFYERKKSVLSSLVDDRNNLIHHFFDKYDLSSVGSCQSAGAYLDEQHLILAEQLTETFDTLQQILAFREELGHYLKSEEGKAEIKKQLGFNDSDS